MVSTLYCNFVLVVLNLSSDQLQSIDIEQNYIDSSCTQYKILLFRCNPFFQGSLVLSINFTLSHLSYIIYLIPLSNCFTTADPAGLELVIPECCENQEVVPFKTYFGGVEGESDHIWYRTKNKLLGSALLNISNSTEDAVVCGRTL